MAASPVEAHARRGRRRGRRRGALLLVALYAPRAPAPYCPNEPIAPTGAAHALRAHHARLLERCAFRALGGAEGDGAGARAPRDLRRPESYGPDALPRYEDEDWPKPARCTPLARRPRPWFMCRLSEYFSITPDGRAALIGVPKAGVTSLKVFWRCTFGTRKRTPEFGCGKRARAPPPAWAVLAGMAREPVGRLVAAYGEVLGLLTHRMRRAEDGRAVRVPDVEDLRALLYSLGLAPPARRQEAYSPPPSCKGGGGAAAAAEPPARAAARGGGGGGARARRRARRRLWTNFPRTQAFNVTPSERDARVRLVRSSEAGWLLAGLRGAVPLAAGPGVQTVRGVAVDERARFRAFLRALECGARYQYWHHAASACGTMAETPRFASATARTASACVAPAAAPANVSVLLRTETLEADARALVRALLGAGKGGALAGARKGCPLYHVNPSKLGADAASAAAAAERASAAATNAHGMPTAASLRALLHAEPELMRVVCRVYYQDYACLGYELPPACRERIC